ncbi:MAG: arginase family protein, partial [Acidobacteriota bacterium]|nr:arginase family protein [Acidobacteriota bacterium]
MSEVLINQETFALPTDHPGSGRRVSILGVPLGFGSKLAGVDIGPAALRVARLNQRVAQLGYEVRDLGDMRIARPQSAGEFEGKANYLREVSAACEELAAEVRNIMAGGELPLLLGGDHSIAIGSIAGVSSYLGERNQNLGLIWFDAHADMNTPETTPSGNLHGMPLAALLGFGAPELVNVAG